LTNPAKSNCSLALDINYPFLQWQKVEHKSGFASLQTKLALHFIIPGNPVFLHGAAWFGSI
jgi:hypothetical protein